MTTKTIELSDDWHQDTHGPETPMGFAVNDGEGEHQVFLRFLDAWDFAARVEEEHPEMGDVLIYPLVAGHGASGADIPRCWR